MFHRRTAHHAAGRPAPDRVPVAFAPLPPGSMDQRPYSTVLGRPPFRIGDVVRATDACRFPAHVGRIGTVVAIGGMHKLIKVALRDAGDIWFETRELELVRTAPTVVMPVVEDDTVVVPVTVVQIARDLNSHRRSPGANDPRPSPGKVLTEIHRFWGTGLADDTVATNAADADDVPLMGGAHR